MLMPLPELQRQYYSGHRHYHCVHTQVVIDNNKKIVHVESGFRGHNNDANTFDMMTPIGDGRTLDFPQNCVLLGDCIYPSRHPVVTPFTSAQLRRLPRYERNIRRKINKNIRKYRVYVEHVIRPRLLKVFKLLGRCIDTIETKWGGLCAYVQICALEDQYYFLIHDVY